MPNTELSNGSVVDRRDIVLVQISHGRPGSHPSHSLNHEPFSSKRALFQRLSMPSQRDVNDPLPDGGVSEYL